jgi:riboflavin synthase
MFTGIIQERGTVQKIKRMSGITQLGIRSELISDSASVGDSIAINGVCLTVTSIDNRVMMFDVSGETMRSTNLGNLKQGESVNLEPALRPSDRLGGHFVTGHIDGTGIIRKITPSGGTTKIEITAPDEVMQYIVKKGSVAVDGISLTVVDVYRDSFTVVIIPHTGLVTTIENRKVNETVNLETDIIGKYVAKFLSRTSQEGDDDQRLMRRLGEAGLL